MKFAVNLGVKPECEFGRLLIFRYQIRAALNGAKAKHAAHRLPRQAVLRHAATLRAGGAMNSGPTGSVTVWRKIRSISALAEGSSDQPATSSTGCN
jgi:hypothetical protein